MNVSKKKKRRRRRKEKCKIEKVSEVVTLSLESNFFFVYSKFSVDRILRTIKGKIKEERKKRKKLA